MDFIDLEPHDLLLVVAAYLLVAGMSYGLCVFTAQRQRRKPRRMRWYTHVTLWLLWPLIMCVLALYILVMEGVPYHLWRRWRRPHVRHRKTWV